MSLNDEGAGFGSPPSPEIEDLSTTQMVSLNADEEQVYITKAQAYNLYTSHFLSTWNIRTYEFAAIIFTQAAYPNTLRPAAIRGIVRTLASICFTSQVGRWVDQTPDRLKTLISTITINRIAVIGASILWFFIVSPSHEAIHSTGGFDYVNLPFPDLLKGGMFTTILFLGILEILSGQGNMLSMERDWVVTVAAPAGRPYDLTHLNAVTKRIDLICKLIAPILISIIISATNNKVGVVIVGGMSACSWFLEIFCARNVWNKNPKLQALKPSSSSRRSALENEDRGNIFTRTRDGFNRYTQDFKDYFSTRVWIPSLALAMLYFSALAYSSNFITFMINAGISLEVITIARAVGSVVEISSTLVTPFGVRILGNAVNHGRFRGRERSDSSAALLRHEIEGANESLDEGDSEQWKAETGCERLGLWGLSWQSLNLVPVVLALFYMSPSTSTPNTLSATLPPLPIPLLTLTLFTFLSLSRLGLWIYDLTTQQLTQTLVPPTQRSSFTSIEYSFSSFFELLQNIAAMVFAAPEQFKYLALLSLGAVAISTISYAGWVWWIRGHLVHWERVAGCGNECKGGRKRWGRTRVGHEEQESE